MPPMTTFIKLLIPSTFKIVNFGSMLLMVYPLQNRAEAKIDNPSTTRKVPARVSNDSIRLVVSPTERDPVYSKQDRQTANRTVILANRTLKHSREAFRRGFMNFSDYELQLKTVLKMKLTATEVLQDRKLKKRFIRNYRSTIDESVRLLRQFRQPAAQGWAGDLKQAELAATEARQLDSVFEKNRNRSKNFDRLRNRQALALLKIRSVDYRQGLANISQLNDAVLATAKPQWDDRFLKSHRVKKEPPQKQNLKPNRFRRRMQRELRETARHSSSRAGVGRSDRLAEQRTKLDRSQTGRLQMGRSKIVQRQTRRNSNRQKRYYNSGTASIFDLTRTWLIRQQEFEDSRRNRRTIDPNRSRFHRNELHALVNRAKRIGDLRGRHAADVSLVKSLEQYRQLSETVFQKQEEVLKQQEKKHVKPKLSGYLRLPLR